MNLSFIEILWLIIAIAISIIAVKITFSFDINKYQEKRQKDIENKIKNYCTHARLIKKNWQYWIQSTFMSPSWTLNYICQKCNLVIMNCDSDEENERLQYYLNNIDEYNKQEKKFEKLLKKWWFL